MTWICTFIVSAKVGCVITPLVSSVFCAWICMVWIFWSYCATGTPCRTGIAPTSNPGQIGSQTVWYTSAPVLLSWVFQDSVKEESFGPELTFTLCLLLQLHRCPSMTLIHHWMKQTRPLRWCWSPPSPGEPLSGDTGSLFGVSVLLLCTIFLLVEPGD